MQLYIYFLVLVCCSILCSNVIVGDTTTGRSIHVCESADPLYLGTYFENKDSIDGVATFSNQNDLSFFRNKGFWYLGNLGPWPPETHYRCVELEGCNADLDYPPSSIDSKWTASKRFGKEPVPVISAEKCANSNADEL